MTTDASETPLTASKPGKDRDDRLIAEREAALYDPDSRFRDHAAEVAAARAPAREAQEEAAGSSAGPSIYAKGEKRRAAAGLTREMIKRMADRAEETSAKRRGE